jgi:membrane-bound metal-dependent hydrolase YbcI (DUF457 family)
MTTFEHAMVGALAVMATGLPRRVGWQIVAVAAVAAISPDWDGAPFLFNLEWFNQIHRVWGHNLWVSAAVGAMIAFADYFWDWSSHCGRGLQWLCDRKTESLLPLANSRPRWQLGVWLIVGILAAWSHLPADMAYSGHATLGEWPLKLLWPFSEQPFNYPLVPWGDIGASLLFAAGIFAMLRWRQSSQPIALATLACVGLYIASREAVLKSLQL